jgi:hypothetical protein
MGSQVMNRLQPPPLRSPGVEPESPTRGGRITPEMLGFRSADESCANCSHYENGMCSMGGFQSEPEDGCVHGFSGGGMGEMLKMGESE